MRIILLFSTVLIASSTTGAQTGASVVNLGYERPRLPRVAPGQVLYLRLHGLTTSFNATQVATTIPLPTDFNGLSVSLQQSGSTKSILLPLLHGDGSSSCNGSPLFALGDNAIPCAAEDTTYDLLVQIPFELKPNNPTREPCFFPPPNCTLNLNDAVLTVREKAGPGLSLRILPVVDQAHVLNSCSDRITTEVFGGASDYATYPCFPAITHLDGSWVSPSSPAKPGEPLVAYAFGLGTPDAPIETVSATPAGGLPVSRPFTISFTGISPRYSGHPEYVGLVGGNAGLYQINFRVPPVPADLPPCDSQRPSNLTMTIQGTSSWDQTSFCVQP